MPRKSSKPIYGFFGAGEFDSKEITSVLDNQIGEEDVVILLPASKSLWTPTLKDIAEWAIEYEFDVRCVADEDSLNARPLKKVLEYALKVDTADKTKIGDKIVSILKSAPDGSLFVALFPDEDSDEDTVLERTWPAAYDAEVKVVDFGTAFEEVEVDDAEASVGDSKDDDEKSDGDDESDDKGSDDEEWEPYTAEELEAKELADLKEIATEDFEIELTPRARKATVIKLILEAQEEDEKSDSPTESSDANEASDEPAPAASGGITLDPAEFAERVGTALAEALNEGVLGGVGEIVTSATEALLAKIGELEGKIDALGEPTTKVIDTTATDTTDDEDKPAASGRRRRRR